MGPKVAPGPAGSHGADPCEPLGRDFQHGLGTSGMETWRDGEMARCGCLLRAVGHEKIGGFIVDLAIEHGDL